MARKILNFAAFYAGYVACVFGAAREQALAGSAAAALLLILHLWFVPDRRQEARLLGAAALVGLGIESLHTALEFVEFAGREISLGGVPLWLVLVWMLFASTLNGSLSWLSGRYALGAALGAVAGPFSYVAAEPIGAVDLHDNALYAVLGLAAVWTITTPLLLRLAAFFAPRTLPSAK